MLPTAYCATSRRADGAKALFLDQILQSPVFQRQIGVKALELAELAFHLLHALEIRSFHAAILRLPVVERGIRNAVLPAHLRDLRTGLGLLQDRNDLAFGES